MKIRILITFLVGLFVGCAGTHLVNTYLRRLISTNFQGDSPYLGNRDFTIPPEEKYEIKSQLKELAKAAGVSIVISERVSGNTIFHFENKTPMETIEIIAEARGLTIEQKDNVVFVKTWEERLREPAVEAHYVLQNAKAEEIRPLLHNQLQSDSEPQCDRRTNILFFRETKSHMERVMRFLQLVDQPLGKDGRIIQKVASEDLPDASAEDESPDEPAKGNADP